MLFATQKKQPDSGNCHPLTCGGGSAVSWPWAAQKRGSSARHKSYSTPMARQRHGITAEGGTHCGESAARRHNKRDVITTSLP